ncbi:MAG: hypothetical protein GY858_04170, partial [Candidatus Omnitrophica bacterium]|nr:hypothetical protein [Candidatus Omnitrophota bacterium]
MKKLCLLFFCVVLGALTVSAQDYAGEIKIHQINNEYENIEAAKPFFPIPLTAISLKIEGGVEYVPNYDGQRL